MEHPNDQKASGREDLRWQLALLARTSDGTTSPRLRTGRGGPDALTLRVVPSLDNPRVLVSDGVPAGAINHEHGGGGAKDRLRALGLQAVAAGWLGPFAGPLVHVDDAVARLDRHLADLLPGAVGIVVRAGTANRANRKPIVKVVAADGSALAYCKVGWNDLTHRLLTGEADALALADEPGGQVETPEVVEAGSWEGLTLLTTRAVPPRADAVELTDERHAALVHEVARRGPGTTTRPLRATPWARALLDRAVALPHGRGVDLVALLQRVLAVHGDTPVLVGTWHGDWTPWNRAVGPERVAVWDWERTAPGVPVGFDVLHHHGQVVALAGAPLVPSAFDAATTAAATLAHLRDQHPDVASDALLAVTYPLELLLRWTEDVVLPAGAWLEPHVAAMVAALHGRLDNSASPSRDKRAAA